MQHEVSASLLHLYADLGCRMGGGRTRHSEVLRDMRCHKPLLAAIKLGSQEQASHCGALALQVASQALNGPTNDLPPRPHKRRRRPQARDPDVELLVQPAGKSIWAFREALVEVSPYFEGLLRWDEEVASQKQQWGIEICDVDLSVFMICLEAI